MDSFMHNHQSAVDSFMERCMKFQEQIKELAVV